MGTSPHADDRGAWLYEAGAQDREVRGRIREGAQDVGEGARAVQAMKALLFVLVVLLVLLYPWHTCFYVILSLLVLLCLVVLIFQSQGNE